MQKIFLFLLAFSLSILCNAEIITSNTQLNSVTVYAAGAELNHIAKATIPSGTHDIVFKNISNNVDENSIQIGNNADLTIMSISFRREFLNPVGKSSAAIKLEDSLKNASNELEITRSQIATQKNALSILDANKIVRGENTGLNVAELQKMVDYYISKHKEITIAVQALQSKETKQLELVNNLSHQVNEMNARTETGKGEIVIQVLNTKNENVTFNISYISFASAWSPMYDLKAKDTKSPLKIMYKANIVQNTGLDWNKVKLSISTSNPSQSSTAPLLSTWYLNYYTPKYKSKGYDNYLQSNTMQNTVQSFGIDKPETAAVMDSASVADFTTINETAINAIFDIDLMYDIPSDNKSHSVTMTQYEVPAIYKYYAVPKLDKDVFLLAEIADWESLNLVPGPANIIFDGTYVGKSFIDPNSTQDTLNISLGRDKKIIVKREKVLDYCSSKLIGSNKQHQVTYELRVKNTRKEAINIILKDQLPMSNNKEIEVEVDETSAAMRNEETGVLTWLLSVAPNETLKKRVSYSVRFPKDKLIGNLF